MSKLVVNENSGKVQDVHFAYVKLRNPAKKYKAKSETDSEFSVDVVVDKDTAKELKKAFNGKPKEVDTAEFEEKYKFSPPFPDQDEQYVFKFATRSHMTKDGQVLEKPYNWSGRPKVYLPVDGGVKDITKETLVGNGSVGDVAFNIQVNSEDNTKSKYLTGILVNNLIELKPTNSYASPFGDVVVENSQEQDEEVPF